MAYKKKSETVETKVETTETEVEAVKTTEKKVDKSVKETKPTTRTYAQDDLIPCRSIVSGALYVQGERSGILYSWADYGDVMDMEYRDLVYMVRSLHNLTIYEPRVIIEDTDFIDQNPKLKEFYDNMYTTSDFQDILRLPVPTMKREIENLPKGAKDAIKGIAATMIDSKQLDSVTRIKALDELFGTDLLLTLVQE